MNNQIFKYKDSDICFQTEGSNVMINATEMAKPFNKVPHDFLRLKSTRSFINAYKSAKGIPEAFESGLIIVINGGVDYGTWMNEDLALVFAQWLSPAFYLWCNDRIKELMKHGITATDNKLEELLANPDLVIGLANQLKSERAKNILLESCNEDNVKRIEEMKPKVLFADAVATSQRSVLVGELAKVIAQNGYEIGQNRLFIWLRKYGYLGTRGEYYNVPTQKGMDLGLFEIKKTTITKPDGTVLVTTTSKVSGKGQIYFVNKFLQNKIRETL